VPAREHRPEFPLAPGERSPYPTTIHITALPTPTPYVPYPDYQSADYTAKYHPVSPCYLDANKTIPIPDIYAYNGIIQGQPDPILGSHRVLGMRDDICFERFGRYGPYGLGYSFEEGGVEVGLDTESAGSEAVWKRTGKIDYSSINWGEVQNRCYEANKHRFSGEVATRTGVFPTTHTTPVTRAEDGYAEHKRRKIPRTAIVVRAYTGFQWTFHTVLNFRALISELALRSGAEYDVHFLLHVRDNEEPIWSDPQTVQRILDENVPPEFHSICTVWSEEQMRLVYPGDFRRGFSNPANDDIHGVYRSAHMPLQYFAYQHPEYEFFWNWELDMRFLGNYYELFDRLGRWARSQSRIGLWERSAKYYIPFLHGSWENFTALVERETRESGRSRIFGPQNFTGREPLLLEQNGHSFMPPSCRGPDDWSCGVGEDADLITLNPIFDPEGSGWYFEWDMTGYNTKLPIPPRRTAIITASRMSRRLLLAMHEEVWRLRHTAFTEMWPATVALHRGMKAVYAPHPVSIDREWDIDAVDHAFNSGRDHSTNGRNSPFGLRNEHHHKGTTWYFHSEFAGLLWRRWLGYPEFDGRGPNGGRAGTGTLRGGRFEEERPDSTGRMCLRSMLLHPIKWEHPNELDDEY
jgi:hypothetical protein